MSDYIDDTIKAADLSSNSVRQEPRIYECTLTSPRGSLIRKIEMKRAEDGPPTTGQLLYYLATQMQIVEACDDFLDWVSETGKDGGDPEALSQYRDLVAELDQFKTVLGSGNFQSLLTALSIDQAISRARPR